MSTLILILSSPVHVLIEGMNPLVRPTLAIAFLCLVLLALRFLPERGAAKGQAVKVAAVSLVVILFATGLALQLSLSGQHGIPQERITTFLVGDEVTNTSVAHSHTGKAFLAALIERASPGAVSVADTGGGIAAQFPHAVLLPLACLFVAGILLVILASAIVIREAEQGKAAVCALAVIAGYVTLVRVADGGIFADNAILALSCLVGVLLFARKKLVLVLAAGFATSLIATFALHSFSFIETGRAYDALSTTTVLLAVFLALGWLARGPAYRKLATVTAMAALVLLPLKAYHDVSPRIDLLRTPVREARVAAYPYEATINTEVVGQVGRLVLYAMQDVVPGEVVDRYGLPYWYAPVVAYTWACTEGTHHTRMVFTLHTATEAETLGYGVEGLASVSLTPLGPDAAGWKTYSGELVMDPCVPRRWDVLRELLRAQGISESLVHSSITRLEPNWP